MYPRRVHTLFKTNRRAAAGLHEDRWQQCEEGSWNGKVAVYKANSGKIKEI